MRGAGRSAKPHDRSHVGSNFPASFLPTPLIRLGASRQSTFSHKGRRERRALHHRHARFHRMALSKSAPDPSALSLVQERFRSQRSSVCRYSTDLRLAGAFPSSASQDEIRACHPVGPAHGDLKVRQLVAVDVAVDETDVAIGRIAELTSRAGEARGPYE
jgi:hypothetical protein